MIPRLSLLLPVLISIGSLHAQPNSAGASVSFTSDLYKISDPHGSIQPVLLPSAEVSVWWRHTFKNNFLTQLTVSTKPYWFGYRFKDAIWWGSSEDFIAVKLDASVGYRIQLTRKLALVPRFGMGVGANTAYYIGSGSGYGNGTVDGQVVSYTEKEHDDVNRYFGLAHAALAIERNLYRSFVVGIYGGYHAGFMKAIVVDVQYNFDQSPGYDAQLTSTGSYWDAGVAVTYKIGKH